MAIFFDRRENHQKAIEKSIKDKTYPMYFVLNESTNEYQRHFHQPTIDRDGHEIDFEDWAGKRFGYCPLTGNFLYSEEKVKVESLYFPDCIGVFSICRKDGQSNLLHLQIDEKPTTLTVKIIKPDGTCYESYYAGRKHIKSASSHFASKIYSAVIGHFVFYCYAYYYIE